MPRNFKIGESSQDQLTFWSEDHLVNLGVWQECDKVLEMSGESLRLYFYQWWKRYAPYGLPSRTYLESCRLTEDGRWDTSSGGFQNAGMGGPTGAWTLRGGASHRNAVGSSLSDILQDISDIHPKYCLSPRACQGILRRAKEKSFQLPELLEKALRLVASEESTGTDRT